MLLLLILPARMAAHAEEPSVLLAVMGDVMLARTVPARIAAHDASWPWAGVSAALAKADLRFCNLECAVTDGGLAIPKRYSFRADPALTARVLAAGNIDIAALANNHTYDYGRAGLADTLALLARLRIAAPGAGTARAGAIAPRVVTCRGLKLAFVAYTWWTPEGYLPVANGVCLATVDETTFADELRAARQSTDLLIVSMHWGKEYSPVPTDGQQRLAHLAIDAGADLVVGHHPHVAQRVETYHDRLILYSLGNCLFDQTNARISNGLLALVRLQRGRVTLERSIPLRIDDARPVPVH